MPTCYTLLIDSISCWGSLNSHHFAVINMAEGIGLLHTLKIFFYQCIFNKFLEMNLWDQRINAHFLLFNTATFFLLLFSSVCATHSSSLQWEAKGLMYYSLSKRQFILCRLQKHQSFQTPVKCNHSIDLRLYAMSLSTAMVWLFSKNLFISAREVEVLCYCYSSCSRLCLHRLCEPWHTSLPNNKLRTA